MFFWDIVNPALGTQRSAPHNLKSSMSAKPIDNERKACDAVVRCLEDLAGSKRANAHSPEDAKVGPPIEYAFDLGPQKYAIEHTIVEAFPGQIHTNVDFNNFITPMPL
jgi:hypothetical protein